MAHLFLSDLWLDAMEALRDEHADDIPDVPVDAKVNLTVRKAPFPDDELRLHLDTSSGYPVLVRNHVDGSELAVTTDYRTAADLFVARDPEKIMKAFFEGRILVQGDVTKLMALQQVALPEDLESRVRSIGERVSELTLFPEGD